MIKATDLYLLKTVEVFLQDIRHNKFLIKDIIGDVVNDPLLSQVYGQKEAIKFEQLINKEIHVNLELAFDAARFPAIAIRVGGGVEDVSKDWLSDGHELEEDEINSLGGSLYAGANVVLGPITAINYAPTTGKIQFDDNVDLSKVYEGMFLYDAANKKHYEIKLVADSTTIYIEPKLNDKINLHNCFIHSRTKNKVYHLRKAFFANETATLICLSPDPAEVIYLSQLIIYMIGRHRLKYFEGANFRIATIQYSPIYKMDEPNIIFARDIQISGSVIHTYIESTKKPIEGIINEPRIADMETPSSYKSKVKKQGWKGEKD